MDEHFNPIRDDETYGGPAIGHESKLAKNVGILWEIIKVVTVIPKVIEVARHNQALLDETGPKRIGENSNDRRRNWKRDRGIE